MRSNRLITTIALTLMMLVLASCTSQGTPGPITPNSNMAADNPGHQLMGVYDVSINLHTLETTVSPGRQAVQHFDVTQYLIPPHCSDCFTIQVVEIDWVERELTANVTVKNFSNSLTGYDVRGIVYPLGNYIILNPHAYTLLHAPPGVTDPSGFRAYKWDTADRELGPGESAVETYVISFPDGAGFIDLRYAIDASWPDHCPEPYDIFGLEQTPLDISAGATADISIHVADWQADTSKVTINTDVLGGSEFELVHDTGDLWTGTVVNVLGLPMGTYPALITGIDQGTLNHLFQWIELEVLNLSDTEPPDWVAEEGIIEAIPGLEGILVHFGTALDPNGPVTYNLYWVEGGTLDFDTANLVTDIESSPYLLTGLNPVLHTLCLRAEDAVHNETTNVDFEAATVGEHPNVWWVDGPNLGVARGWSGSFVSEGYFWVLGGSATGTMLDTVERYNISTGTWDSPWSLPEPRDAFACGTLDGYAYIFGGRFAETDVTDTCESIELSTGIPGSASPALPVPRANMGSAIMDGVIYMAGGRHFTGTAWEAHRETYSFTPPGPDIIGETDLEFETYMCGFAAGGGKLYQVGGTVEREDVTTNEPGAKSWQWIASLIPGRQGNGCVYVEGWIYSVGGDAAWGSMSNVDVLDIEGDTWYSIEPINYNRTGAAVATDGTYIYVAGGVNFAGPATIPLASFEVGRIY